mmetsp:Transcript_17920/g.33990  ORF Transcript_17920/g.33990 Transcript_17920/m.33990 type:complete len:133 (-) Transcript_17920:637-1035(-)
MMYGVSWLSWYMSFFAVMFLCFLHIFFFFLMVYKFYVRGRNERTRNEIPIMPSSAVGRGRIEGPDQTSRADGIFPQFPNGDPDVKRNAHFIHGTVVVLRLMVSKMGEALACSHQALLQAVHRSAEEGLYGFG